MKAVKKIGSENGKNWEELSAEVCEKMGNRIGAEICAYAMLKADRERLEPEDAIKLSFCDFRNLSRGKRGGTKKTYNTHKRKDGTEYKTRNEKMFYSEDMLDRIFEASIDTGKERKRAGSFFVPSDLVREVKRIDAINNAESADFQYTEKDYTKQARKNYALVSAMEKSHLIAEVKIECDIFTDGSNTPEYVDTFNVLPEVLQEQKEAMREIVRGLSSKQLNRFTAGLAVWKAGEWNKNSKSAEHKTVERIAEKYGMKGVDLFENYLRLYA